MTLSIYLGIFDWCINCSWWLIPLLIGAWILGWLFWDWTKGRRMKAEAKGLHGDIKNWKKKFTATETDLAQAKYDREQMSGEFATVKSRLVDSGNRYNALEEKLRQVESTVGIGGGDVDVSKWENQILDLEAQLETSRSTNLKLQDDYASLKTKFTGMQAQLDAHDLEASETNTEQHLLALKAEQNRVADLEKKLALSNETNVKMEADYAMLKSNYGDLEMNLHSATNAEVNTPDFTEERISLESRIADLEKKLALSYESNTKMEADYADLKTSQGTMEMNLLSGGGASDENTTDFTIEREGLQTRISELEMMLASRSTEEGSEPGEGKKKLKKKSKLKKKGKVKKESEDKGKQGSAGQNSGYALAFANDNLQIIEGIGPKIEGVLKAEKVNTWKELSQTSPDRLSEILVMAGPRYKMHDASSWPEQAELANKNKWGKLVALQKVLGSTDGKESDSKAEKLYFKHLGFAKVKQDDHKVIEGIGPKIESLLKEGGIKTWKKLSESKQEDIQVILDAAGSRYKLANPGTWPKQAKMANEGDWAALKVYQDKLDGGKE